MARIRTALILSAVIGLMGLVTLFKPLETAFLMLRNAVERTPASGEIVVVAIDDESIQALGSWPWPRRLHAEIIDRIEQAGAARIFFYPNLSSTSAPEDDARLLRSLEATRHPVALTARTSFDPITGKQVDILPVALFRTATETVSSDFDFDYDGSIWSLPYSTHFSSEQVRSFSLALADKPLSMRSVGNSYPIRYAIDPRTIPIIGAAEVASNLFDPRFFRGKTVVITVSGDQVGDVGLAPGYGLLPAALIQVLGAETLKLGIPRQIGFTPPFVFAVCVVLLLATTRRRSTFIVAFTLSGTGLILLPFLLDHFLISVQVMPALMLVVALGSHLAWMDIRHLHRQRALVNPMSGLPNLEALRREPTAQQSLIVVMRVLNFPEITSSLPSQRQKLLVEQIARRLQAGGAALPYQSDDGLFAMLRAPQSPEMLAVHLTDLQGLFRSPIQVEDEQLDLAITLGVDRETSRPVANRISSALLAADQAATEGVEWKCHDPAQLEDSAWRLSMLSQLDSAIDGGDIWVAYQPKYEAATRRLVGAEALARWTHPTKGPIRPDVFVGAAEQSNRIVKLTLHVLDRAVDVAKAARAQHPDFTMAVNLSAKLLESMAIVDQVAEVLRRHALPAGALILELTETAALSSDSQSLRTLHALRSLGLGVAIDDYGTGMSTLDYLKRVPATEIKIDRSFVMAMDGQENDRLLVSSTVQLAHLLGLKVVAEGVEKREALDLLVRMGCDLAQGYLLSYPLPDHALFEKLGLNGTQAAA